MPESAGAAAPIETTNGIERLKGVSPYRSSGSAHNGLVFCLSTANNKTVGMGEQARLTLSRLDRLLAELGSDRRHILQTTIYLADAALKPEFDVEWKKWIGEDAAGWPPRAGIGVMLSPGLLCEVVLIAAQVRPGKSSAVIEAD
jgi:enamine deaminase RidA (YjgF/YER057c/UK114 family)